MSLLWGFSKGPPKDVFLTDGEKHVKLGSNPLPICHCYWVGRSNVKPLMLLSGTDAAAVGSTRLGPMGSPRKHPEDMMYIYIYILGGGFKYFLFSPLPGEMIQFDKTFLQMG